MPFSPGSRTSWMRCNGLRQRAQAAGSLVSTPQQTGLDRRSGDHDRTGKLRRSSISRSIIRGALTVPGPIPITRPSPSEAGRVIAARPTAFSPLAAASTRRSASGHGAVSTGVATKFGSTGNDFRQFHTGHEPPGGAGGIWQHDAAHRHGVPYRDPETAARFPNPTHPTPNVVRGFASEPSIMTPERPRDLRLDRAGADRSPSRGFSYAAAFTPSGSTNLSVERTEVRGEAARGFSSRMASPRPAFRPHR